MSNREALRIVVARGRGACRASAEAVAALAALGPVHLGVPVVMLVILNVMFSGWWSNSVAHR